MNPHPTLVINANSNTMVAKCFGNDFASALEKLYSFGKPRSAASRKALFAKTNQGLIMIRGNISATLFPLIDGNFNVIVESGADMATVQKLCWSEAIDFIEARM